MAKQAITMFVSAVLLATCEKLPGQSWNTPENVTNNTGIFDQQPSLDVGPAPNLSGEAIHIGYNRVDTKEISYALKEFDRQPAVWNIFQVTDRTATNAPNSENWEASLKVFATGRVYVAYRGDVIGADSEIFITNNVNGSFNFLPVFVTNNSTDDGEPALFIQGTSPHVAYTGQGGTGSATDDEIWYDDFMTASQVLANGSPESAPALVIDSNGKAHIAYAGIGGPAPSGDKEIWYAENTSGPWVVTQVSVNSFEDTNPSIWLEPSGTVHIAWQGLSDDWDIYYSNNLVNPFPNANSPVATEFGDEQVPSLVIDPFGDAHIAYQWLVGEIPDEEIYYTDNRSGTFTAQMGTQELVSTSPSDDNLFPSMDIDSNNHLHLVYQGFELADNETEIYYTLTVTAVPVELVSFTGSYLNGEVTLRWLTASETNNFGFEIQRKFSDEEFERIGFVEGKGTTTEMQSYSFVDTDIRGEWLNYRLKQIDLDGSFSYSQELEVTASMPLTYRLDQNYPNPFNPSTAISFALPASGLVRLDIYNLQGEHIINLLNRVYQAGNHSVSWNGEEQDGHQVASGIYLARLKTSGISRTIKMVKIQ